MNPRPALALGLSLLFSLALVDCSSADTHESPEECEEIASLCHPAAELDEDAADCHNQAHEGELSICLEIQEDCLALCGALVGYGGAGGGGGAGGAHD